MTTQEMSRRPNWETSIKSYGVICRFPVKEQGRTNHAGLFHQRDPIDCSECVAKLPENYRERKQTQSTNTNSVPSQDLYLIMQRRDSCSFNDIVRGQYQDHDYAKLSVYLSELTCTEKNIFQNWQFRDIFDYLFINKYCHWYTDRFDSCERKWYLHRDYIRGVLRNPANNNIHHAISEVSFPKGRLVRNYNESPLQCALREWYEESNIDSELISVYSNMPPLVENYIGSDDKRYTSIYFLADYIPPFITSPPFWSLKQKYEVANLGWFDSDTILKLFYRDVDVSKRQIFIDAIRCFSCIDHQRGGTDRNDEKL